MRSAASRCGTARRRPPRSPGGDDTFALAVLVAAEDARLGDFDQALRALDAAAALRSGVLPDELTAKRAAWALQAGGERSASPSGATV